MDWLISDNAVTFFGGSVQFHTSINHIAVAEAMAIREALSWLKDGGYDPILLESDVFHVVQAINASIIDCSYVGSIVKNIKTLLHELQIVCLLCQEVCKSLILLYQVLFLIIST